MSMFLGFISRWMILRSFRNLRAMMICAMKRLMISSGSPSLCSQMKSSKVPLLQYSMKRKSELGLFLASMYFRIQGWVIFRSRLISCRRASAAMEEELMEISFTANIVFLSFSPARQQPRQTLAMAPLPSMLVQSIWYLLRMRNLFQELILYYYVLKPYRPSNCYKLSRAGYILMTENGFQKNHEANIPTYWIFKLESKIIITFAQYLRSKRDATSSSCLICDQQDAHTLTITGGSFLIIIIDKMATFNTYDYEFLLKCLAEGSIIFKSEAIKRLNTLAGADKKQFVNHLRGIMNELQSVYREDKEDINYQSIMLLNEIVTNIQSKQLQGMLYGRHLQLIIPALGHPTKTALRKAAHTVLLNTVKTYPQFNLLVGIYLNNGILSQNELVQQKSINSFQSIFILEVKHFDWNDENSQQMFQALVDKIEHENSFVSKAASQCLLSMCKMEGVKQIACKLEDQRLLRLKKFLEITFEKIPSDSFFIHPVQLQSMLGNSNKDGFKHARPEQKASQKYSEASSQEQQKRQSQHHKNHSNQRRLQKIKRSIKKQEKKVEKENHGGKLFSFITGEGSLKERTQAMQDLLYKIQVSKNKPEFEASIKAVFPTLLKMLKDTNPKIVSLTLRILQNCIEWVTSNDGQLNNLVSVIVEKLGDQKISIRQNVSKVIKELANKTNKAIWIKELMDNLRRNTSTVLKDETLHLIHHIYESCPRDQEITVATGEIIDQISHYTDDPKTKIKIRTLDCLSVIVFHSKEPERYNFSLKGKMSSVFYQMYLQKLGKLQQQGQKKAQQLQKKMKRDIVDKVSQETYRTIYRERRNDAKSEGENDDESMNVSMQTVKKRVSLLRKPRNLLSTQQTISVDQNSHRNDRSIEDVEIVLPSLYKKTGSKFNSHRKNDFTPNKTIQGKSSDYLSKDDLKPLRDPQKQMKNIMLDLKSADWKIQFEATNKLRRVIQFHPDVILGSAGANLHALVLDMIGMVQNLRSSVAKNSLICLNQFIVLMGKQIDAEMDIILQKLIKKSADTNVFISSEVQKCLNTIGITATTSKILEKLAVYRQSKSTTVKEAIVNTLYFMKQNEKIRQKEYGKLAQSLAFYLQDGQLEVRSKAKLGIVQLSKQLGDWYRALRGKINPIYFKSICQLMTKSPTLKKQQNSNTTGNTTSLSLSPVKNRQDKSIQPSQKTEQLKTYRTIDKVQAPPPKKKLTKVAQFPQQFNSIQGILQGANSSDWKKRIESLKNVKQLALQYPNEFIQYRSASHFIDTICKQISEPNIKVSINGMNTFLEIFEPLKMMIENNLGVICNSIFAALSNNKAEIKESSQKCTQTLFEGVDLQLLMQFICHGALYSLPRSRVYLVNKLTDCLQVVHDQKRQLLYKNVFPLLNKLMEQYKAQLMPHVVNLFDKLYEIMGNAMFGHLTKFKEVRQLINK